jgi:NTP pyrophosphatase (non-canonical NTP hydrolase)
MAKRVTKIERAVLYRIAEECNELAFAALKRAREGGREAEIDEEIKDVGRQVARWKKITGL